MIKPTKKLRRIAVIGASSVMGKVDTEFGGFTGRLRTWWEEQDDFNAVFNLGIWGNTTEDILARMKSELKARKPNLIIFSFGNNDSVRDGNPESTPQRIYEDRYRENITQILQLAKEITPNIMVLGVCPINEAKTSPVFWDENTHYLLYDVINYQNIVEEVSEKEGVQYLNIMSTWLKRGYKDLLHSDGLHANIKGHEMIFDELQEFLIKNFDLLP